MRGISYSIKADPTDCPAPQSTAEQAGVATATCSCAVSIEEIVEKALDRERRRVAAEVWAALGPCFDKNSCLSDKARRDKLCHIASGLAFRALMNVRSANWK